MIERRSAYLKASTCRSSVGWQSRAYLPSVALLMICCPIEKICRWSADDRATVGLSENINLSIDSWVIIAGISPERHLTHDLLSDRENLSLIGRWSNDGWPIWKFWRRRRLSVTYIIIIMWQHRSASEKVAFYRPINIKFKCLVGRLSVLMRHRHNTKCSDR